MKKLIRLPLPGAKDIGKFTSDSAEMCKVTFVKTKNINYRRKRQRVRRRRYTTWQKKVHSTSVDNEGNSWSEKDVVLSDFVDAHVFGVRKIETRVEKSVADQEDISTEKSSLLLLSAPGNRCSEDDEILSANFGDKSKKIRIYDSVSGLYGTVSIIGRRREMEDEVRVELGFTKRKDSKYDFFGVYDGHGGVQIAQACRDRLHRVVAEEVEEERSEIEWERVVERCFCRMDEEVNGGGATMKSVGSTVVVAVVGAEEVVVANCGDCRAVLARDGVAVALSNDHKPCRPDELKRIEDAGGRVINWNGFRVLGVLATSRSIGDQYLKPFVICKPEVTVIKRTDKDEFLILASDGLWDVVSNEVACNVVRRCLGGQMRRASLEKVNGSPADKAAMVLAELAMARGSHDNISVIVVGLRKSTRSNSS